jgi:hypothetical protein
MKVWPKNDSMRKLLRHPSAGGFPLAGGPADWPKDQWLNRRILDGDVLLEDPAPAAPAEPHPPQDHSSNN